MHCLPFVRAAFVLLAWLLLSPTFAQTPAENNAQRGLQIVTEAQQRNQGFVDSVADMQMTLHSRRGDTATRRMRTRTLEVQGDGDMGLVVFDDPLDVKGTALLTHSHKHTSDDQWLYLPALKRVKRISSSGRSGPFMGSEFSYEDLASQEVEKYTYEYLRDERLDGREHYVVARYPKEKKSGYTREVLWLDHEHYRIWKVEYYDRKNSLLKTLVASDFKQYLDRFWRAHHMHMLNHQTTRATTLKWAKYVFDNGLTPRDFDRNSLANTR